MTRRVKNLRVSTELLLAIFHGKLPGCACGANPLPTDAKILVAMETPNHHMYSPDQVPPAPEVLFTIESSTFPEFEVGGPMMIPELDPSTIVTAPSATPETLTLTADQLREMLYDADRQPGRRVTLRVQADGTYTAEGF